MYTPRNSNGMNLEKTPLEIDNVPKNNKEIPRVNKFKSILREVVIFALIAFGIVLPFRIYVAEPYLVDGRSMDPTFKTGDYLIVDKLSYRTSQPERNSVLVFKYPGNPKKSFIKRIIGLPGETVIIKDKEIKIVNAENPDGIVLEQEYVVHSGGGASQTTLAGDEYFVMGDNRLESYDSRSWGPLQKKFILGKPILRLLPLNQIKFNPGELLK